MKFDRDWLLVIGIVLVVVPSIGIIYLGMSWASERRVVVVERPAPRECPEPERHPGAEKWICGEAQWIARFPESFDAYACFRPKE